MGQSPVRTKFLLDGQEESIACWDHILSITKGQNINIETPSGIKTFRVSGNPVLHLEMSNYPGEENLVARAVLEVHIFESASIL